MADRRLAVILAHPDDESRIVGGTLALYSSRGCSASLYCATRGEAGDPSRPAEEVAALRRDELEAACLVLGVSSLVVGEFPDGGLAGADHEEVLRDMVLFLRRERPHVVISFGPDGRTGHPDHVAAGRLAEEAFERARDPRMYREHRDRGLACWQPLRLFHTAVARSVAHRLGWRHPSYPDDEFVAINAASVLERKRLAAAGAHASQWALSPFNLSRGWEPHEVEHYRLARNAGPPLPPGTGDLFAGIE